MNSLALSTFKLESYNIIKTLPETTLIKLAYNLGIKFEDNKIESYEDWINGDVFKEQGNFKDNYKNFVDDKGKVLEFNNISEDKRNDPKKYKTLCIIHYVGYIVINTLLNKNLKYSILRAQNKAIPTFNGNKVSGPNVSYRSKNYMNYGNRSQYLTLNSNPIVMNADIYSNHPDQRDLLVNSIQGGGQNAQLYCSNIYEKLINQTIEKYKSLGYTINQEDISFLHDLTNKMRDNELKILDLYSDLMSAYKYRELLHNPSLINKVSEKDKAEFERIFKEGKFDDIKQKKKELDEILKKEQKLTFTARQSLEIMYPFMKDIREYGDKIIDAINNKNNSATGSVAVGEPNYNV